MLTAATIAQWNRRRDEQGPEALIKTREPVNKFPDLVSALLQQLQALVPIAGRRKLAEHLARAGLHFSASTVKRRLEAEVAPPMPPDDPSISGGPGATSAMKKEAPRAVVARATNHVWGADLTLVPLLGGFAVPWLPFAWAQRWPLCWWVLLVVDHFSRSVVHVALFAQQPKEAEVVAALERAVSATGPPKHFITDQGVQFQGGYRAFCQRHGIRHRYGAIGKHGSIAIVERLNRTLKREGLCLRLLPLSHAKMLTELRLWQSWYNECRPHARWRGATPAEARDGRLPAAGERRFEMRKRWPRRALVQGEPGVRLALDVTFLEGRRHLPVVTLKQVA